MQYLQPIVHRLSRAIIAEFFGVTIGRLQTCKRFTFCHTSSPLYGLLAIRTPNRILPAASRFYLINSKRRRIGFACLSNAIAYMRISTSRFHVAEFFSSIFIFQRPPYCLPRRPGRFPIRSTRLLNFWEFPPAYFMFLVNLCRHIQEKPADLLASSFLNRGASITQPQGLSSGFFLGKKTALQRALSGYLAVGNVSTEKIFFGSRVFFWGVRRKNFGRTRAGNVDSQSAEFGRKIHSAADRRGGHFCEKKYREFGREMSTVNREFGREIHSAAESTRTFHMRRRNSNNIYTLRKRRRTARRQRGYPTIEALIFPPLNRTLPPIRRLFEVTSHHGAFLPIFSLSFSPTLPKLSRK